MPDTAYSARRATLDDLEAIRALAGPGTALPVGWEQRLTEFQLACAGDGRVVAALALRIEARQGWIHTEAWAGGDLAGATDAGVLRRLLVERVEAVARNHGLTRLWTHLEHAAYEEAGFAPVAGAELEKRPVSFTATGGPWRCRRLKDENQPALSLEQEMDLFFKSQREANQQLLERARVFKVLAWVLLIAFMIATILLLIWAFRHPGLRPPVGGGGG